MAHLPTPDYGQAQRLDVWLKGPVYYDQDVSMRGSVDKGEFSLFAGGAERPSIIGRIRPLLPGESLRLKDKQADHQESV